MTADPEVTPAARSRVAPAAPATGGRWKGATALFVALLVALVAAIVASAVAGAMQITPGEVLGSVMHRLGLNVGPLPAHPNGDTTLWSVRFPRIALAVLVGAALAVGGALMQGIFGNPLAEPGVIGVASGASMAASIGIVFSLGFAGSWTTPVLAFVGGLVTTLAIYLLSRNGGRTEVVTLVLTGIAINAMTQAGMAFLMFLGDNQAREEIVFWTLGSLNGTRWPEVAVVAPMVAVGLLVAFGLGRQLDLLALGDRAARHVGVDVERLRVVSIVLVALLTAAAVSFAGTIAFVGLVVPHLVRLVTGPSHRVLLPASALGGALLLVVADLWARTAIDSVDLPIGMLTSLVGGPIFFWLIRRTRKQSGGWA